MAHIKNNVHLSKTLPSYKKPPVNEVVCGIRFETPEELSIPHIGILWNKYRSDYPIIKHAPPIASVKGEVVVDKATGLPFNRVWFINKSDDKLIQFQFDRFYFNWRRRKSAYPRYVNIIRKFERLIKNVEDLYEECELGQFKPIETELSYINYIPKEEGWDSIDHLPRIFLDFAWKKSNKRFLPIPKKMTWEIEFPLQDNMGVLIVKLKEATIRKDKSPLLVYELTARGICTSTSKKAIREWFDVAHEWIVRGFTDLTTHKIQKIWEREDNA